jgi:transposase InsO family protein
MAQLKTCYSLGELSQALEISPSGFAAHGLKEQRPRRQRDLELIELMKPLFQQSRGTYGSPRLRAALHQIGERCGKNRINRLMRQQQWKARQKRRFRPRTTDSSHPMAVAPNHLAQREEPGKPNEIWQSDITYIPTQAGWAYLAVTLDRFSRKVVGWKLKPTMETSLVTEALEQAQKERQPPRGLLHHSDRGIQYASSRFQRLLQSCGAQASMSRRGNCYDNALAESFFATLKTECIADQIPATHQQARLMVFDYIETFYNPKRLHSALGYQSPVDFEKQFH